MTVHFGINILTPAAKVVQYTQVLMFANCNRLHHLRIHDDVFFSGAVKKSPFEETTIKVAELEKDYVFRALLFCAFVHPDHFLKYGKADNWYDSAALCRQLRNRTAVYKKEGLSTLQRDVANQMSFITKIQHSGIDLSIAFPEESVERYEKYMTLVKRYDGVYKLAAPLDVSFVWRAHMLDHKSYVSATKQYFGKVLDYDDRQKTDREMKNSTVLTEKLWEKHYGSSMNDDGYPFWLWYNHHFAKETKD